MRWLTRPWRCRRRWTNDVGGADQIVVDDIRPIRILHLQQRHPALDRGIGHHDIDSPTALLDTTWSAAARRAAMSRISALIASARRP
jgi:hypothetical protein